MRKLLLVIWLVFSFTNIYAQKIIYVKQGGAGTGVSWENPFGTFDAALVTSKAGDQIWVAGGVYKPSLKVADRDNKKKKTTDCDKAFVLRPDVKVYGGFSGTETSPDQRVLGNHVSTLSGDIGVENDSSDNAYHVVVATGYMGDALLDGFTITDGNADFIKTPKFLVKDYNTGLNKYQKGSTVVNGTKVDRSTGGGMYNYSTLREIQNITFDKNRAAYGGGMYNEHSYLTINNVVFSRNKSIYGGGIFNHISALVLTHALFSENSASYNRIDGDGGGIFNNNSMQNLTHVVFIENVASRSGGGMYNQGSFVIIDDISFNKNIAFYGGGITNSETITILANAAVISNTSVYGAGIYNHTSIPIIANTTIRGNNGIQGAGIYNYNASSTLRNVSVTGNKVNSDNTEKINGDGGGIYNYYSQIHLENVTISGNHASNLGGGMYNTRRTTAVLENTILWGNNTEMYNNNTEGKTLQHYRNSLVQGTNLTYYFGLNGIDTTLSVFVKPEMPESAPTLRGNYRLAVGSPAINKGMSDKIESSVSQAESILNKTIDSLSEDITEKFKDAFMTVLAKSILVDVDGVPRIIGDTVDLGAYEFSLFQVRFESNSGTLIDSVQVAYGETIGEPAIPTRENYIFEGWYKESDYVTAWDFSDIITQDIVLYAKWKEED